MSNGPEIEKARERHIAWNAAQADRSELGRLGAGVALALGVVTALAVAAVAFAGDVSAKPLPRPHKAWSIGAKEIGRESGNRTASGEPFHPNGMTCARPSYRAGKPVYWIIVTNLANGKSARCKVNNRGPAGWTHRILDVSRGMALTFGVIRSAEIRVAIGAAP